MRFHLAILFTCAISAGAAAETNTPAFSTNALSLEWVTQQVLLNNPALKAAEANWRAMKQRIPQARAWEDLRLGVDVERYNTTDPLRYSDTEWMVTQEFPLSGKNRIRGKIATSEAATALFELKRKELDLLTGARVAYFKLANALEQYELNLRTDRIWKEIEDITRQRYEVGTLPEADVLMARTEIARVEETLIANEKDVSDALSELNVLMNRDPKEPLAKPITPDPAHLHFTPDQLQQIALSHRPEILIADAKIDAAKRRIELAKKQWIPDPELRVEARQVNGINKVINEYDTGVFIRFPWLNRKKYNAAVHEAEEMQTSAEQELASLKQQTLGMITDQLKKVETFHHHAELFSARLLPLAQQTTASRRRVYQTEKGNLLEMLTAQRMEQEIQSMYWHHLTEYHAAVAELEGTIGMNLNQISTDKEPNK
jgi:cobalt-zinc-cadmium efflux system outer membrane protein